MTAKNKKDQDQKSLYTHGLQSIKDHVLPQTCHSIHSVANRSIASDLNLRPGSNRHDYYAQRPNDKLPVGHSDIILSCQAIYRKIGMVRNIIDLMTDFAAEGLELQHPVKSQERFFREWARRVNLQGRAHDFMKLLMRDANVIVRRKNAYITRPAIKEFTQSSIRTLNVVDEIGPLDAPEKIRTTKKKTNKHEIPWKYTFLSPVIIEKIGGEVGRFFGSDALGMRIPTSLASSINSPKTLAEKSFVKQLPAEVVLAAKKSNTLVALDMNKMYIDYYKKDDWEDWGTPFLYGILEDVLFKQKMRLADIAALDGVINVIRLWRLGKSDQQILPTKAAVDKLIDILEHNTGGGVMDLVWDDMIDLKVEYPPTDKILGPEKYRGVNADIVRGLGIPDSLVGGADLGTRNAQSAFVQLKTLAERLEYVRGRAIRWIENELHIVADAMGFKRIASVSFGTMSLRDEAAEKQLIIQLLDRGIVSAEKVSEAFGTNYMIELERLKNEEAVRTNKPGLLERADPYHRPFSVMEKQNELAIELEKVKQGFRRDSEFPNRDNNDNGGGSNPIGDQPKNDSVNTPGRPPVVKETKPRDVRTPKTQSVLHIIADSFMDKIDMLIDPKYLHKHNIKNMRSLNKSQRKELEGVKRSILSVIRKEDNIEYSVIADRLSTSDKSNKMETIYNKLINDFIITTKKQPTSKERRMLASLSWAILVEKK